MSSTSATGRWPVILSGRAIRELRFLGRDQKTFDIIKKKFNELSHGQMSTDNYLAIRGTAHNIPIYRSRASADLRIIYQIDLSTDSEGQLDHQVIKVFSVSSRARVSYDFWVKVSKYLVRLGSEYQRRCTARKTVSSETVYVPERFPHRKYDDMFIDSEYAFQGEAELHELHETLVLQKFTPVTKSLYNSILADIEAVLPMALNPDEKRIVRHQGTSVVIGRSGTGKTTALIYKLRANAQAAAALHVDPPIRQLFVTRSPVLTRHIASNYNGLLESTQIANKTREELAEIRQRNDEQQERELVEFDNEVDLRDDLPDRFSRLEESHFPLFISFDKLCLLLEADIRSSQASPSVISFKDFKHTYWPKIDFALTRNLDAGLVFSEILGVIKGNSENLSREEYVSALSEKKSPLLSNARDRVYSIFVAYSKKARILNQIDGADRTRAILNAHQSRPLAVTSLVDYIFVDEVQDQLMIDVHLIQSLCSDPDGGYWCGDTAQTISVGSSFRIKDLKSFIYENMLSYQRKRDGRQKTTAPFSTFELSVNFRSHSGIVRFAASIVELIYTLFPNSIDHMAPETGRTPGPVPLLFISQEFEESVFVEHLLGSSSSGDTTGTPFGAHQAIIVRSQSTANSLTTQLQKRCTVLTLLETKGLEFDDIIIYNFFSESDAPTASWRYLLTLASEINNGRVSYHKIASLFSISPTLCSELKQLYVAVTRARYRCWLWDSGEIISLTKEFWLRFGLLAEADSLKIIVTFASSTKDSKEWIRRGQDFFSSGLYALAKSCFERADQSREAEIADAYQHMTDAKETQNKQDHLNAAAMMERCALRAESGAHSSNVLWYHAASCFEAAQDIANASRSYRGGKFYDRAALLSFDKENFDDVLLTILPYSRLMEPSTYEKIRGVSRMHYLRTCNYEKLRVLFDGNQDACIDYARSLGFSQQLKHLLRESSRHEELATVHLAEGSPADGVECILKSSTNISTLARVEKIALDYFWLHLGLEATPGSKAIQQSSQLLEILSHFERASGQLTEFKLRLFKASLGREAIGLDFLHGINLEQLDFTPRLVLGCHHVLRDTTWTQDKSLEPVGVLRYLWIWHMYEQNLLAMVQLPQPSQDSRVQQLLGCSIPTKKPRFGTFVHICGSSLLHNYIKQAGVRVDKKTSRGENLVERADVDRSIKHELQERLKIRLFDLHVALLGSYLTSPSILYAKDAAVCSSDTNSKAITFEFQMGVTFMAALLLSPIKTSTIDSLSGSINKTTNYAWIMRLFSLLYPPTGTIRFIPTLPESFAVEGLDQHLRNWIGEYIYSLKSDRKRPDLFLSTLLICLSLSCDLDCRHRLTLGAPHLDLSRRPLIGYGHSAAIRAASNALSSLFCYEDRPRVGKCICAVQYLVYHKLNIDLGVLVHLIERITREAILAERLTESEQLLNAFSGLIVPSSWAKQLISYPKLSPVMLDSGLIGDLAVSIGRIIMRIQREIPAYWKPAGTEMWRHSAQSLSIRMYWCIALMIVNIPANHPALPVVLEVLRSGTTDSGDRFECEALHTGKEGSMIETLIAETYNQQTCLSSMVRLFQHEDLVLLARQEVPYCPAKERLVPQVITFDTLTELRQKMLDYSTHDPKPTHSEETEVPIKPNSDLPSVNDNRRTRAVEQIQRCWRRIYQKQNARATANLGMEGECYQRLARFINERIIGTTSRHRFLRKVLRGPGLLVVLSLEMMSEQLENLLDATRAKLQVVNIGEIESVQKSLGIIGAFHATSESLRKQVSPDSPSEVFQATTLVTLKTSLTSNINKLFSDVSNSDISRELEGLGAAEAVFLRGTGGIRTRTAR